MRRSHKGKNGTKKYGRNEAKCERYRREKRREKNKLRKVSRHFRRHPHDLLAEKTIQRLYTFIHS